MTETTHAPNDPTAQLTAELRDTQFRLNQALVQQEALYHAGLALGATLQVEEVIGEILPLAVSMVDARSGFLFLRDERSRRFSLVHEINLTTAQQDVLGTDAARKKLRQVMSMDTPLYCAQGTLPGDLGGHHLLVVCVGEAGFIGVIDKESRQGVRGFDEEDGHLLELMGRQAGTALVNARLYRSVREERNLNQNIFSSIANGLISTDAHGAVVQINPAVQRIFAAEQSLIGKSSARLFQRYGCKRIATALKDTLTDGRERSIDGEYIETGNLTLNARITALRDTREQRVYQHLGGERIAEVCDEHIGGGTHNFILDLENCRIVNSIGISILIEVIERVKELGGKVAFCNASPTIAKTFRIMGLLQTAELHEAYADAQQSLGA